MPKSILPRQHGAWSILAVCFILGVAANDSFPAAGWLVFFVVLFGFFSHHAIIVANYTWAAFFIFAGLASSALMIIFCDRWLFIPFGSAMAVMTALTIYFEKLGRMNIVGRLIRILNVSLIVPAVSYAVSGEITRSSIVAWISCAIFFSASVFRVQSRIRRKEMPLRRIGMMEFGYTAVFVIISVAALKLLRY